MGWWEREKGKGKMEKGIGVCNGAVIAQEGKFKRTLSGNVCIVIKPSQLHHYISIRVAV